MSGLAEETHSEDAVREVVIDASVASKWLLRDEDDVDRADMLLDQITRVELVGYAPRQIHVEVAAAIRKAVLTSRLSMAHAEEALDDWLEIYRHRLVIADNEDLLAEGLRRALGLGITLFDALYVVLAERLDATLVVADLRLTNSAASQLGLLRELGQFELKP